MLFSLPIQSQEITINEINYRSVELQQDIEFVELYNMESTSVNLSGWSLTEAVTYEFPAGTTIPANGYIVVCADPDTCQSVLGFSGAMGPYSGGLSGKSDEVVLRNNLFEEVDKVDYDSWQEWPNVRYNNDGDSPVSIQKMHPNLPGHHGGSWQGQVPTPGNINSNYNPNWTDIAVIKSVSQSPNHPVAGEDVRIKAEMRNLDLLSVPIALELQYQIVEPGNYIHKSDGAYNTGWISMPMLDNGMGADSTANNGTYTAAIPSSVQVHRRLIRYRVRLSTPAIVAMYPDQNHPESNYAYYVYDGYPTINGFDINAVNPIQDVTVITADTTAFQYIGPGTGINNDGQYTGYDYLGEGTLVYNGKVYDHVRFRPRGRTNGRAARVKPGVKFKLNKERQIASDSDCGDEYEEEQDAFTLSGTYVNDITTHGATESMIHKILNLTGAMGRHVDYTQLRVVDEVNEDGNTGDFWGVFLILENYDGDYLKEHDLPDGNIWRHKRSGIPPHRMTYQGDFPNTDSIGDWSSHHPDYAGFVDRYLNHDLISSYADVPLFISDKVANNFFANGAKNYEGKHSQREYYNSETGKWVVWYGDYDTTFGMTWDDGTFFERSSSDSSNIIRLVQDMSGIWTEYQNEMRSAYDLLFNQEQADFLVDMESRLIYDPTAAYDWTDIDHSRWNQFYDLGDVGAHMAWYKTWFQERGDFLAQDTIGGFYDPDIPETPDISLTGSGALDDMTFSTTDFADPQGATTFSALEWRVGEWSDPSNPYYTTVCDPIYEVETVWRSGEITTFSNTFTIPSEAYLKANRTYKIRVRYKDNTGKWSHWSAPEDVIPTPATQIIPNIVINEIMYNPLRNCGNEFVEIINAEAFPVDVGGFAFTDGIDYQFPKNKIMQPGEILVLAKDSTLFEIKYGFSPYGDFSSSISNDGEKILLAGLYDTVIDSLTYNDKRPWDEAPDGNGPSLELLDVTLDNTNPISWFRSMDNCGTPGQPNSRMCSGTPVPIVINEINYNSPDSPDAGDWVELHNTTADAVDISNWGFYDGTNEFLIPTGTVIEPEGFMVLSQNDTLFSAAFPHLTNNTDYIGNFGFSFSGGGERITIFDNNDCLTDYVSYDDDLPWDTIPDGNGPALSLIDPSFDNTNYNSWESSSNINSAFGTPGRANTPCPEVTIVFPDTICATIPIVLSTDTTFANLDMNWFVQGIGLTPGSTVNALWNTPGNYNVQLITNYFECSKVYNTMVTVLDCNLVPELVDDEFVTYEDTPLSNNVLNNDTDPDIQDNLTVDTTPLTSPTNGTLVLNADGSFIYTPNQDFYGLDTFEYEACDDGDPILCETALVEIKVISVDDAPIAVDDIETTQEDSDLVSDVLSNDSDVDGDPLTVSEVTAPMNGTLTLNPDGTYTYTPNPNFNGTDSFEYSVCDVSTIPGIFFGQVAVGADDVEERADNGVIDTSSGDLDMTDDSPNIYSAVGIRISNITIPQGAIVTSAYLEFKADESQSVATSLTINAEAIGNALPIPTTAYALSSKPRTNSTSSWANIPAWTQGSTYETADISPVVQEIINRNDWSTNNAMTFIIEGTGTRTAESFEGATTPKLIVNYKTIDPNPIATSLCDTAIVNITIEPVNDAPIAADDSFGTIEDTPLSDDVSVNDSDVDSPIVVTTTPITAPANGTLVLNADGTFTYTPDADFNGTDSFEYEICDGGTPALCGTALVEIVIDAVNDAPVIAQNLGNSILEDTPLSSSVMYVASDIDGDALTANLLIPPINGTLVLNPNGTYDYVPNLNFNGTDAFTYEICDDGTPVLCTTAQVNINIDPVNDIPIAVIDTIYTFSNTSVQDNILLNDWDIDGDNLVTAIIPSAVPTNGTITVLPNGNIDYVPNPDYIGTDHYEYEVCDDGNPSLCNTTNITVIVDAGCVDINLNALLEGPLDPATEQMSTTLNTRGLLPGQTTTGLLATPTPAGQPYSTAPWNYTGTEGANWIDADYDTDIADWVLVSFRTDIEKSDEIAMTAGLIDKSGNIEFPNRCALPFTAGMDSLYVVIEHRNHMGVMSPVKIPVINSTLSYDFRFSDSFRYSTGFGQKQLPSGLWTMYAGDINQMDMPSYDITGLDKVEWFENNGVFDIYLGPDLNFDGDVNGADKAIWIINNGISSRVSK